MGSTWSTCYDTHNLDTLDSMVVRRHKSIEDYLGCLAKVEEDQIHFKRDVIICNIVLLAIGVMGGLLIGLIGVFKNFRSRPSASQPAEEVPYSPAGSTSAMAMVPTQTPGGTNQQPMPKPQVPKGNSQQNLAPRGNYQQPQPPVPKQNQNLAPHENYQQPRPPVPQGYPQQNQAPRGNYQPVNQGYSQQNQAPRGNYQQPQPPVPQGYPQQNQAPWGNYQIPKPPQ